jgi:hypothetical protein
MITSCGDSYISYGMDGIFLSDIMEIFDVNLKLK